MKALFEIEFDPANAGLYELVDLKLRFEQIIAKIEDLMFNNPEIECLSLYHSAKSLQSVSKMFQEMILMELPEKIIEKEVPKALSTPRKNASYSGDWTFIDAPTASQLAAATSQVPQDSQPRSRSRIVPQIIVENADQSLSNSARILNQTVNVLRTPPNPANNTYLTLPSPRRMSLPNPVARRGQQLLERELNNSL